MKVIVTTGPSYEPIDEVRRLTNFSTGELGARLAQRLGEAGFEVFCLRGVAATYPGPTHPVHPVPFTTNQDLYEHLVGLQQSHDITALFHVAALCDFKVGQVTDPAGRSQVSAKLDSHGDSLTLHLEPARKVISGLRGLFPRASIVGWKYELVGSPHDALAKAWRQLQENQTDGCILNGRAYGPGFAFCTPPDRVVELRDKTEVIEYLPRWLAQFSKDSS